MRARLALAGLTCCSVFAAAADAGECKVGAERAATSPLAGIERVEIEAQAGDLHVNGVTGSGGVDARGKACASSDDMMAGIELEMTRDANVLHIRSATPSGGMLHLFGRSPYATLDLTVTLPANLPVKVTDSSGDLEVAGVLSLDLRDDSGDILVHDVAQDVVIDDDSGDLTVTGVQGNVTLKDGSGDIKVNKVAGKVEVTSDGSGDINVDEAARGLAVLSDGSGDINFSRVRGSIQIPAKTR
ncbi:MAG TPA: DUF4097 family beta strand repeat-containing protein [Steroidobacteraceae bacterium]|nr:DUF4097 family beta strand repeat-containing protein [Steroidobacteraceae bacterium]